MATREEVVRMALSQVGQAAPDGDDKYIRWFNEQTGIGFALDGTEWCSIWVTWVYSVAGVDTIPVTAGCTTARNWFQHNGRWADGSGYTPRPGDAIYFDWDLSGDCDHVGIVEKVENGAVYTVEGNSGNRVAQRVYAIGDRRIAGYGLPDFEEEIMEDYGGAPKWLVDEGAAQWLTEQGVFKGDEAGEMHWNENITRAECGALIYRLAKLAGLA